MNATVLLRGDMSVVTMHSQRPDERRFARGAGPNDSNAPNPIRHARAALLFTRRLTSPRSTATLSMSVAIWIAIEAMSADGRP
jgi:hypothetical protein